MIKVINNFLDEKEIQNFLSLYDEKKVQVVNDTIYKFNLIDLLDSKFNNVNNKFKNFNFHRFRIQMVNENITQIKEPHIDGSVCSFTLFLNDNYKGGELVFKDKVINPRKGTMVYFLGNLPHSVNDCVGDRFTLVGFLNNNPLNLEIKKNNLM